MGRCYATVIVGVVAGMLTAQDLTAQQTNGGRGEIPDSEIETGARVRIATSSSSKPLVGWVDALESGGVRLVEERDHTVVTIPRAAIRRIERSRGRRSGDQQALPGLIAGGLLGLVVGVVTTEEIQCRPGASLCVDLPDKTLAGIGGSMFGMLAGGLVSSAIISGESWEDASLPTLTAGADSRGGYLALRIPLGPRRGQ